MTICALLCCRPIVKPEFFTELVQAVQRKEPLPKFENFKPVIDEPSLNNQAVDLNPRTERKSLFREKTFVFLNVKQMKRLHQAISCGGGRSQLLEEGSLPVPLLESTGTCVVDVVTGSSQSLITPTTKKWVDSVGHVLHRNGLRFITESEVGLAAIYVSNETYCNPCSSADSESAGARPAISESSLSQNATVNETVLPAASQNITAYVANTEASQTFSRMDVCGTTAVGETPEKRPELPSRPPSAVYQRPASSVEQPNSCTVSEPVKSSVSSERVKEKKAESALSDERNSSSMLKKSPQKQSALTSYFQPVSKKRLRGDSADSEVSQAKLSKQDEENKTNNCNPNDSLQNVSTSQIPINSNTGQKQHVATPRSDFSASLGLGSGLAVSSGPNGDRNFQNCDSSLISGSKKRKEPIQDQPSDLAVPTEGADLDLSLEELESIMSVDMDEPAASKKQRLGPGKSSRIGNQQGISMKTQKVEQDMFSKANKDSERRPKASNRATESKDVKEEEVSFVVTSKAQNDFAKHDNVVPVKQEHKGSSSVSTSENDSELPRRVLQVQFKSLTVSAPSRTRSEALQSRDPNGKNFKGFRKVPVPGLQGLPSIIGGSDLVAHNRSKNSELEEWLRDAAEEEKRQEREETLGDDLFRYNPKPSKRR